MNGPTYEAGRRERRPPRPVGGLSRRQMCLLLPSAWVALAGGMLQCIASDKKQTLTGFMIYATETEVAAGIEKIPDPERELARLEAQLQKTFPAGHYHLLGRHTAPVTQKYSIWLKPSPQFPLQLENTGYTDDGGLALYWILWQKEPLPTKDRELVKSSTVLKRGTPLIIGGPKWRDGRLLFVVRMD